MGRVYLKVQPPKAPLSALKQTREICQKLMVSRSVVLRKRGRTYLKLQPIVSLGNHTTLNKNANWHQDLSEQMSQKQMGREPGQALRSFRAGDQNPADSGILDYLTCVYWGQCVPRPHGQNVVRQTYPLYFFVFWMYLYHSTDIILPFMFQKNSVREKDMPGMKEHTEPPEFCQSRPRTTGPGVVGHQYLYDSHKLPVGYDGPRRYVAAPNLADPSNFAATMKRDGFDGGLAKFSKELKRPKIVRDLRKEGKIVWKPEIKRKGASPREVVFMGAKPPGPKLKGTYCLNNYNNALWSALFNSERKHINDEYEDLFVDGLMSSWALDAAKFDLQQLSQRLKPSEFTQADLWHINSVGNIIGEGRFLSIDDFKNKEDLEARGFLSGNSKSVFQVSLGDTEEKTVRELENWVDAVDSYTGNISLFARCCPFVPFSVRKSVEMMVEGTEVDQPPALVMLGFHTGPVLYIWPAIKKEQGQAARLDLEVEIAGSLCDLLTKGEIRTRIDSYRGAMIWIRPNAQSDTKNIALMYPTLASNRFVEAAALLMATCDIAMRTCGDAALARVTAGVPTLSGAISVSEQSVWSIMPHMWGNATFSLRPSQFLSHVVSAVNCFILVGSGESSVYEMRRYQQTMALTLVGQFCSLGRLPDLVDEHYDIVVKSEEYVTRKATSTPANANRCFVTGLKERVELVQNNGEVSCAAYKRNYIARCAIGYEIAIPREILTPRITMFEVSSPKKDVRYEVGVGKWMEDIRIELGEYQGHPDPEKVIHAMRIASNRQIKLDLTTPVTVGEDKAVSQALSSLSLSPRKHNGERVKEKKRKRPEERYSEANPRSNNVNDVTLDMEDINLNSGANNSSHPPMDVAEQPVRGPVSAFMVKMAMLHRGLDTDGEFFVNRAKAGMSSLIRHEIATVGQSIESMTKNVQKKMEVREHPDHTDSCVRLVRLVEDKVHAVYQPASPVAQRRVVVRESHQTPIWSSGRLGPPRKQRVDNVQVIEVKEMRNSSMDDVWSSLESFYHIKKSEGLRLPNYITCTRKDFGTTASTIKSLIWLQEAEGNHHRGRLERQMAHYYRATLLHKTAAWVEVEGPVKRSRRFLPDKHLVNLSIKELKELARMNNDSTHYLPRLPPGKNCVSWARVQQHSKNPASKMRGAKAKFMREKLMTASHVFKHWLPFEWQKRNEEVQKMDQYKKPHVKEELKQLYHEMAEELRFRGLKRDEWEFRLRQGGLKTRYRDRFVHPRARY